LLFEDRRLLFFDRREIAESESVTLTLNAPAKCGPCLSIEKEWELGLVRASSILSWRGSYRLYYSLDLGDGRKALAFAESSDGVSWTRPSLGAVSYDGSTANNLVDIGDSRPAETCVFADPTGPDEHRFRLIGHDPYEGVFLLTSPDGVRFRRAEGYLLTYSVDNHMSVFYDPRIGRFRLYMRGSDRNRPILGWSGSRMVIYAETDDLFKPLEIDADAPDPYPPGMERPGPDGTIIRPLAGINRELPAVMRCDEHDPPECDMYQAAAVHYAPDAYVAFPTLYYHYPGLPEGYLNDGVLDIQFASSREGTAWQRDLRCPYVRLDLPGGPATKQMHMLVGMVPHGHTLSQYYMGRHRTHGEGRTADNLKGTGFHEPKMGDPIALRLEQRMDGFVSADSAYTGGRLVTVPFELADGALAINIDTSASGVARAALLDESGGEIDGFGIEQSDRIQGNDTRCVLSWRGRSDLSPLAGAKIRFMLQSRGTKLFALYP
jgi:hypothetical protein